MLRFVSDTFKVDENIIKRLLVKHTSNCKICKGKKVINDSEGEPIHCKCWHAYNREYQLYAANIPAEYHFKTTDNLSTVWRGAQDDQIFINLGQYRSRIKEVRRDGFGLYLKGNKGSGTSFIGGLLLMHAIEHGMTAYFMQFRDFIDMSLKGLRDPDINEDINNLVTNIDFLLFDDVDSVPSAKSEIIESIVPNILKKRSYIRAPIITTAIYGKDQLPGRIGDRLASVLTERVSLLTFKGNVKRQDVKELEKEYFKTDE